MTTGMGCDFFGRDEAIEWTYRPPSSGLVLSQTEPALIGDRLFAAVGDRLVALDTRDGALVWTAATRFPYGALAGRVLADEDQVFLHDVDWVRAFDARSGTRRWSVPLPPMESVDRGRGAQNATHVFVPRRGEVVAIAKESGTVDWRGDLRSLVEHGLIPLAYAVEVSPDGSSVYVAIGYQRPDYPTTSGTVVAYDATTGTLQWVFDVPNGTWTPPGGSPQPSGAAVYGIDVDGNDLAFASGLTVWVLNRVTGVPRWSLPFTQDGFAGEAVRLTGSRLIVGSLQERVFCLDRATGETVWQTTVRGSLDLRFTVHNDALYFTSPYFGESWGLDLATGRVRWRDEPSDDEYQTPIVVDDDHLFVVGSRAVYALRRPN